MTAQNPPIARYHPIDTYLSMGTHKPRAADEPLLEALQHDMTRFDPESFKFGYFYGWMSEERGEIAECQHKPSEASAHYDEALSHWETAYDHTTENQLGKRIMVAFAIQMTLIRQSLIAGTAHPAPIIPLQRVASDIAGLTVDIHKITINRRGGARDLIKQELVGHATELLFASILLRGAQNGGPRLLPYPASPRQECPNPSSGAEAKSTARDFTLKLYTAEWQPVSSHPVQIKTHHSAEKAGEYEPTKVTVMARNTELNIANNFDALGVALALRSNKSSSSTDTLIENAQRLVAAKLHITNK